MNTESNDANESDTMLLKNKTLSNLERLKKQKEIIEARIQSAEARLKTASRKQATRRKILVGSYYLDKALKENAMENLKITMCGYLTRESDRKLFGFSEKPTNENAQAEKTNPPKALTEGI
jgi:large subunit ribosomal protein L7/L12